MVRACEAQHDSAVSYAHMSEDREVAMNGPRVAQPRRQEGIRPRTVVARGPVGHQIIIIQRPDDLVYND